MLWWILFTFVLTSVWFYVAKYWLPPKLVRCVPDQTHFQGLSLGPK